MQVPMQQDELNERIQVRGRGLLGADFNVRGGDYLLHFLDPQVVTENLVRRGFAPPKS